MISCQTCCSILGYDIPCGVRNIEESDRIVGGSDADRGTVCLPEAFCLLLASLQPHISNHSRRPTGEFPWQISLQRKKVWSLQHICGGAIVAPFWVVTAGHCVEGLKPSELSVVAGDHDLYKAEGECDCASGQRSKLRQGAGLRACVLQDGETAEWDVCTQSRVRRQCTGSGDAGWVG